MRIHMFKELKKLFQFWSFLAEVGQWSEALLGMFAEGKKLLEKSGKLSEKSFNF